MEHGGCCKLCGYFSGLSAISAVFMWPLILCYHVQDFLTTGFVMAYSPFLPPLSPYILPQDPFDALLAQYGVEMQWMKGHECPCVYGNYNAPGSPDPGCNTCGGRGVYWDTPSPAFFGLLTHIGRTNFGPESGSSMDKTNGGIWTSDPVITIPASQTEVWSQASVFDAFMEPQAPQRFNTTLSVGYNQALPYQQSLSVAASGAVRVFDPQTKTVINDVAYTVSSGMVFIDASYGEGTAYTVEYEAAPVFVVFRKSGGAPHYRPFGQQGHNLPLRLHCQLLDIWTRARHGSASSTSPMALP
ncbi:MAG: hypothetical protein ACYCS8_19085 [Acidithiobacillus sp.]